MPLSLTTEERVFAIVARQLGPYPGEEERDPITRETRLKEDLGAESLEVMELAMDLEEEFGIDIKDDLDESVTTVGELVDLVDRLVSEQAEKQAAE